MAYNSNFKPFHDPKNEKSFHNKVGTNYSALSTEGTNAVQLQREPAPVSKYLFSKQELIFLCTINAIFWMTENIK